MPPVTPPVIPGAGPRDFGPDAERKQQYLVYCNAEGHLLEATFRQGSWKVINMTGLAWAPPSSGEPTGLVSAVNGARYYVYRGRDGHLHEVCFLGSWNHRDLGPLEETASK
jgi:hypothetical protein